MKTKICTGCNKSKKLSEFSEQHNGKFGRNAKCKDCKNKLANIFYYKNRNKILERQRETRRKLWRYKKYGVSDEEYKKMYKLQGGRCAICKLKFDILCLDHSHSTNKNRGLLCRKCNWGLGYFNDNINSIKNALKYLQKYL